MGGPGTTGPPAGDGPGYWLRGVGEGRPAGTMFRGPTATEGPETEEQARIHLETPMGAKSFLRGAQFF